MVAFVARNAVDSIDQQVRLNFGSTQGPTIQEINHHRLRRKLEPFRRVTTSEYVLAAAAAAEPEPP